MLDQRSGEFLTFYVCALYLLANLLQLILPLEHPIAAARVKAWVEGVEVLRVEMILRDADGIAEITLSNRWEFCLT